MVDGLTMALPPLQLTIDRLADWVPENWPMYTWKLAAPPEGMAWVVGCEIVMDGGDVNTAVMIAGLVPTVMLWVCVPLSVHLAKVNWPPFSVRGTDIEGVLP